VKAKANVTNTGDRTLRCRGCGAESTESECAESYCRSCFYSQTWGYGQDQRATIRGPGTGMFEVSNGTGSVSRHRRTFRAGMRGNSHD
jgi:hypothetical protein